MKRLFSYICLLCTSITLLAEQKQEFSFSVRIGGNFGMPEERVQHQGRPDASQLNNTFRMANALDLGYAYLWPLQGNLSIGIQTGISLGYSETTLLLKNFRDQYQRLDEDGWTIDYTITADRIQETATYIGLEVPVLFALRTNGFYLNAGPRLMTPLGLQGAETFQNVRFEAVLNDIYVYDPGIGQLPDHRLTLDNNTIVPRLNLFATIDLGYEWRLHHSDSFIGIGAYTNLSAFSTYHQNPLTSNNVIDVVSIGKDPTLSHSPAVVQTHAISESYSARLRYFDFGVRVFYAFDIIPYRPLGLRTGISLRYRNRH